jgi:hypothetical protein
MRDLARSLRSTGRPVPPPWRDLARLIKPRGQNLLLVLAAGGVGKSAFMSEWALSLGRPVCYVSLDTDKMDHGIRIIARELDESVDWVQDGHDDDPAGWAEAWGEYLESLEYPIRYCDATTTVREIGELLAAETEYWGESPMLTIVDNLSDVLEGEEGAGEYRQILLGLKRVAQRHDTLVVGLHHLRKRPATKRDRDNEDADEGTQPVHISDALFPVDQHAQYVLGLWRPQPNRMAVGILKNRMGPMSRLGNLHVTLNADLARMRIESPVIPHETYVGLN